MGQDILINVHSVIPSSRVNGPGNRLVVFFQGCARNCPGCFNPDTHPFKRANLYSPEELFKEFMLPGIEGITVSGGEPFYQVRGLSHLLKIAKEGYGLSTVVYTGFMYEILMLRGNTKEHESTGSRVMGHGSCPSPLTLDPCPLTHDPLEEGFIYEKLTRASLRQSTFRFIDVLIDGAYEEDKKEPTLLARGSTNQRFYFITNCYQQKDFYMPAKVEITIGRDGTVRKTGFSKIDF